MSPQAGLLFGVIGKRRTSLQVFKGVDNTIRKNGNTITNSGNSLSIGIAMAYYRFAWQTKSIGQFGDSVLTRGGGMCYTTLGMQRV